MRKAALVVATGALALTAVAAHAKVNMTAVPAAKAKAIMHDRHEGMEKVGKLMKQLARETKAEPMNMTAVKANAAAMNVLANRSANWFHAGTGPEMGKTGAKAEIWKDPKDFGVKIAAWQAASAELHKAAQGGNAAAIGAGFANLGKSCKSCHELYRKEMH